MRKVTGDMSMSVDGFVAGPDQSLANPSPAVLAGRKRFGCRRVLHPEGESPDRQHHARSRRCLWSPIFSDRDGADMVLPARGRNGAHPAHGRQGLGATLGG
jgi:hypothetical protein